MYSTVPILIAQMDSRLESFSGGFRRNRAQIDSGDVILLLTGLVVVFSVLWLVARWSERRVRNDSSLGLFWTLAKAHEISWGDCWLLWRLARAKRIVEPALLFLDPRLTSPQSSHHLAPHSTARLRALRRQLFSGIDRPAEVSSDAPDQDVDKTPLATAVPMEKPETSLQAGPATKTTGGLEEALSALRELNLQDQPIGKQEPLAEPPVHEEEEPPPTAELPASAAPVLDLYPWLGNDWQITNSDE